MMVSICQYLFFVVIIKDKDKKLPKCFFRIGILKSVQEQLEDCYHEMHHALC